MIRFIRNNLRRLRRDDEGVTLVEYGIGVVLAVTVGTFMLGNLGQAVTGSMENAVDCMETGVCDTGFGTGTGTGTDTGTDTTGG